MPESLSTSILWQVAQAIGFALVIIMDLFRDTHGVPKNNMHKALIFQAAIAGVCLVFAIIFNSPMTRSIAMKEQEEMRKARLVCVNSKNNTHSFFDSSDTLRTLAGDGVNTSHKGGEIV